MRTSLQVAFPLLMAAGLGWSFGLQRAAEPVPGDDTASSNFAIVKRPAASRGDDEATAALRRESNLLRAQLRTAEARLRRLEAAAQAKDDPLSVATRLDGWTSAQQPGAADDDDCASPELEDEWAPAVGSELHVAEHMHTLHDGLEQDGIDADWSAAAVRRIEAAVARASLAGSTMLDIDCRATLCRAQVLHDDRAAVETFDRAFPAMLGRAFPDAAVEHLFEDGSPYTVMYLGRAGYGLPDMASD